MLSASQKLQRVPDLIANGDFDQALIDLSDYQTESVSILAQLETVVLEERERGFDAARSKTEKYPNTPCHRQHAELSLMVDIVRPFLTSSA